MSYARENSRRCLRMLSRLSTVLVMQKHPAGAGSRRFTAAPLRPNRLGNRRKLWWHGRIFHAGRSSESIVIGADKSVCSCPRAINRRNVASARLRSGSAASSVLKVAGLSVWARVSTNIAILASTGSAQSGSKRFALLSKPPRMSRSDHAKSGMVRRRPVPRGAKCRMEPLPLRLKIVLVFDLYEPRAGFAGHEEVRGIAPAKPFVVKGNRDGL
jgi:hypothetical protein